MFINVKSRMAWVSPATFHRTRRWTAQQPTGFTKAFVESANRPTIVLHDRDPLFGTRFRQALAARGANPLRLQIRSPNLNAYAERFIQTLQHECLNHFLIFGTRHMDHLVEEFLDHYHDERPHQSMGNLPLKRDGPESSVSGAINCKQRLGGLLRHYHRGAA